MEDCIFCQIAGGKADANIVFKNKDAVAFLDINPLADGHTVVIPKNHYRKFSDIPNNELEGIFTAVQKVTRAIRKGLGSKGCNIGINDGKVAGQAIPHTHIHIISRNEKDGGKSFHGLLNVETSNDFEQIEKKIKKAI